MRYRPRITIRELVLLVVIAALLTAWGVEAIRASRLRRERDEDRFQAEFWQARNRNAEEVMREQAARADRAEAELATEREVVAGYRNHFTPVPPPSR